jgi:hypothetical protein
VTPVLVVEREPDDPAWQELCGSHNVGLAWPADFSSLPADLA